MLIIHESDENTFESITRFILFGNSNNEISDSTVNDRGKMIELVKTMYGTDGKKIKMLDILENDTLTEIFVNHGDTAFVRRLSKGGQDEPEYKIIYEGNSIKQWESLQVKKGSSFENLYNEDHALREIHYFIQPGELTHDSQFEYDKNGLVSQNSYVVNGKAVTTTKYKYEFYK